MTLRLIVATAEIASPKKQNAPHPAMRGVLFHVKP
jgi:hypothetical protein